MTLLHLSDNITLQSFFSKYQGHRGGIFHSPVLENRITVCSHVTDGALRCNSNYS